MTNYKQGFKSIAHSEVKMGETVYFDNFQEGKFPDANPKISGPFVKIHGNGSGRCFENARGRSLMHYPENLIVQTTS